MSRRMDPMLKGILIELGVIVVLTVVMFVGLRIANSRMGLSNAEVEEEALGGDLPSSDSLLVPETVEVTRTETVVDVPEASWPVTPCSLFVSGTSNAVLDILPEASATVDIPIEVLLLSKKWGTLAGLEETELDRVYSFQRGDTVFVDLPRTLDPEGLARTIEGRFVCFTRLVPLVSGTTMDGFSDGLPLRGVPGSL
jgi:hypothetical protein